MTPYTPPSFKNSAYNCPLCNAFAQQKWDKVGGLENTGVGWRISQHTDGYYLSTCSHCHKQSVWLNSLMVYPNISTAPLPNPDMPPDVLEDYQEAREILHQSPRGAAALLRLAIQKLCIHLGENGKNINDDIANLVKKGLPEKMQKALDTVRVIGNNAVHPGQIDLKDDIELSHKLFGFVNIIIDVMITQPKQIDDVYNLKLPEGSREAIDKRDKK